MLDSPMPLLPQLSHTPPPTLRLRSLPPKVLSMRFQQSLELLPSTHRSMMQVRDP